MAYTPLSTSSSKVEFVENCWDISFTVDGNIEASSEEEAREKAMRLIMKTFPDNFYRISIINAIPTIKR